MAVGGGRVPDYPGADESNWRGIVVPWFVYRGPVFSVDERGIRGRFVDTSHWELDFTATAAFNTRENERRAGMPELDYLFGIGPQLVYKGWQGAGGSGASAHFKLRAIQSTDFKRVDSRGGTFSTELRWREFGVLGSGSVLTASIEPTWASQPLQRYFYGVSASEATATRPAYEARAGYLGTDFGLSLRQRLARCVVVRRRRGSLAARRGQPRQPAARLEDQPHARLRPRVDTVAQQRDGQLISVRRRAAPSRTAPLGGRSEVTGGR
ncbi:MipA/OmpV family protein [Piscinibacter aquaticus]|uniref:MipA/OmpV family protein n=1 Tax=Piscinibacter aquaticus TaxID=392597 RepID=A0A5C6U599_9BURK|nr:MipA/OmpV family protein [Piscinibacter aquaticus]